MFENYKETTTLADTAEQPKAKYEQTKTKVEEELKFWWNKSKFNSLDKTSLLEIRRIVDELKNLRIIPKACSSKEHSLFLKKIDELGSVVKDAIISLDSSGG